MTSTFEKIINLGTNYLFLSRTLSVPGATLNYIGRWNGNAGTFESVGGGVSSFSVGCISVPSSDNVYVCGSFTTAGGSVSVNRIAYWNGSSWSNLAGATVFNNTVQAMAYDSTNSLLYASSYETTTVANRISKWNGSSWTGIAEPTVNTYCKLTIDGDGNLYAGYGTTLKRYLYQSSTWETLSSSIGGTISDIKYNGVDNRVYITLYISSGASVKYYDITNTTIGALTNLGKYSRAVAFDSTNNIYVACQSPDTYQGTIVKHNGSGWDNIYNYQNTSGVLDLEIDANDYILGFANAGSLVIGIPPYTTGNWQGISQSSNITYGGPRATESGEDPQPITYQLGDNICLTSNNSQHGIVIRMNPLSVQRAIVVRWSTGPVYSNGKLMAYFGSTLDNEIELLP
jgi:hypothetical protein